MKYGFGILVDLLTDYEPGQGVDMFYQSMGKALDNADATLEATMELYGIEHKGYDWAAVTKDENGNVLFTEAEVNETLDSLDSVLQQALPDVFKILASTGTLDLSSLGVELGVELGDAGSLFEVLSTIVSGIAYKDSLVTTIYNALLGIFGGGIGQWLPLVAEAGIAK